MRQFVQQAVCLLAIMLLAANTASAQSFTRPSATSVDFTCADGKHYILDFYGPNIVRLFSDPAGGQMRQPEATPPAEILVKNPRRDVGTISVSEVAGGYWAAQTTKMKVKVRKADGIIVLYDAEGHHLVTQMEPTLFEPARTSVVLSCKPSEYFFGGGVQNGRFSHRGRVIAIENTNNWVDGGVTSPAPFFWSTGGYAIMPYTFRPGKYDFGATNTAQVRLTHDTSYLDLFLMVNQGCVPLLRDYYQLTGNPVLLPKFGFYEGHLNAYNKDYWTAQPASEEEAANADMPALSSPTHDAALGGLLGPNGSVLFEDGICYKESPTNDGGIRESLNGELEGSYQFSARAVIDRYAEADMPLGWVLPNDGYGSGYGQDSTLDANIANLRSFGEYARSKGVEIGLWTQSDLHPKVGVEALLQRDIEKEVGDAGVRVLKTDVAWVGAGYSFGLNGVAEVSKIMSEHGDNARPFIISLDGWAGTQRYAGIWSGDQTGGEWEYIRFHIPTYIGSGLSGQPNISSDMDGIFGGRNIPVNVRDYQWKTFTPMQLNMDGWGANAKYPQALGEPATSINRTYLKLKSILMPYLYTVAHEAIDGLPMIRPVIESTDSGQWIMDDFLLSTIKYQFLCGPSILVAPIYQNTAADDQGNDIRNDIYLPKGQWIDFFSGECYEGGQILNGFKTPLWKLPVFIRRGAIIPLTQPHNNPNQIDRKARAFMFYPKGHSETTVYDDDGRTEAYRTGAAVTTRVESELNDKKGHLTITVHPAEGQFQGFEKSQSTEFIVNLQKKPKKIVARVNGSKVELDKAQNRKDFMENTDVWFYDPAPEYNRFATGGTTMAEISVQHSPRLYVRIADEDITQTTITLDIDGYAFDTSNKKLHKRGKMSVPVLRQSGEPQAYSITPSWQGVSHADYYELKLSTTLPPTGGVGEGLQLSTPIYTQVGADASDTQDLRLTTFTFTDLKPETDYEVAIRAVNADGSTPWATTEFRTVADPLRLALRGLTAETSCDNQPGQDIKHLFDFDEKTTWHTAWSQAATPFDMTIDLHVIADVERIQYIPRPDAGNGTIIRGFFQTSLDNKEWSDPLEFQWAADGKPKDMTLNTSATIRYIRMHVEDARGSFGSGQQLYVFRKEGTEVMIPGDINHDNHVDENDMTSYMNYNGLRRGDGDFEGYISNGDLNRNGLIDAYDISAVAIELEAGVSSQHVDPIAGTVTVTADKTTAKAGDIITLRVRGKGLVSANAISFAIPYDATKYEYVGVQAKGTKEARNLTIDRLHTNGQKALYPTFINCGEKPYFEDGTLLEIRFRAKHKGTVTLTPQDGMLVDKFLNVLTF